VASFGLIIFGKFAHIAGTAPDTTPQTIPFNPEALRMDLAIFDNSALIAFSDDGKFFSTEREFPAGVLASLDIRVRVLTIRNKTVASPARFDITVYSDPILIQGREYVRNP
jgi:hypothetical protein